MKGAGIRNGRAIQLLDVPLVTIDALREWIIDRVVAKKGSRVVSMFISGTLSGALYLFVVLANDISGSISVARAQIAADSFPSLTPQAPQVHLFEREIAEQYGVRPEGHPWLKPVRFHHSYRAGRDAWGRPSGDPIAKPPPSPGGAA